MSAHREPQDKGNASGVGPSWNVSLETIGEVVLLTVTGAFLLYMFVESFGWRSAAQLMPRIVFGVGAFFWVLYVVTRLRGSRRPTGRIMDTGFRSGADQQGDRERFIRIIGYLVGLYLGIWLIGIHIALPVGTFFYLYRYGKAGLIVSSVISLVFLALIVGVYDRIVGTNWGDPLLFQLFGLD